jgi:hypothetical protein
MLVMRLIAFAVLVAIGASFLVYAVKKDRRYLEFAYRLLRYTLILALIFGLFYFVERVLLIV